MEENLPITSWKNYLKRFVPGFAALGSFLLFLIAIELLVAALKGLGQNATETILLATSNPFTGLFIGLLVTAIIQSSSTTTALVVAMVASGSLSIESAVPIIMGANIGTTITSTIVSLGFINKKKEFQRAIAAGTFHDFFNIITAIILFPLEYYYGFLSQLSIALTSWIYTETNVESNGAGTASFSIFDGLINFLVQAINNGFVLALFAILLLFGSILIFRKLISEWLRIRSQDFFGSFFFKSAFKSFAWGMGITAAIRSSTVTTSLVVPLVAKKVVRLNKVAPFILGANIGTTITAFIAAIIYANNESAIVIATSHFLFNAIGVVIFLPIPVLKKIPLDLANGLGKLTLKYRLSGLVYLLLTFFFIPFSLIYFNRNAVETITVHYEKLNTETSTSSSYKFVSRFNKTTKTGDWISYADSAIEQPVKILPIYLRNNVLFFSNEVVLFSKPGFCWDGENKQGRYQACVEQTLSSFTLPTGDKIGPVFVIQYVYKDVKKPKQRVWVSSNHPLVLQQSIVDSSQSKTVLKIISFKHD